MPITHVAQAQPDPEPTGVPAESPALPSGEPVVDEWTARSRTFATETPDTFVTELYTSRVNFVDEGSWVPIQAQLERAGDLGFQQVANSFDLDLNSAGSENQLVSLDLPSGEGVSFGLDSAVATSAVPIGESALAYANIRPHMDLSMQSLPDGVKEVISVGEEWISEPIVFNLEAEGLTPRVENRQVVFSDEMGADRLVIPPGVMWDSAQPQPAESDAVEYHVSPDGSTLSLSVDEAWVSDPARVWPIQIDPTLVQYAAGTDTYVNSATAGDNSAALTIRAGKGASANQNRAFLRFATGSLTGMNVHSATLTLYQVESFGGCTGKQTDIYTVTDPYPWTNATSWPGPAYGSDQLVGSMTSGAGYSGSCPADFVSTDITQVVDDWANGGLANRGLALVAADESNSTFYKKYGSAETYTPPSLQVLWTDPTLAGRPNMPTNVAPQGVVTSATPTFSAQYSDPQGDPGRVVFRLYDDGTGALVDAIVSAPVSSGASATVTSSALTRDRAYRLRVSARDEAATKFSASTAPVPIIYPSIYLSAPLQGASVDSSTTFTAALASGVTATSVAFEFNGVAVANDASPPYSITGIDLSEDAQAGSIEVTARIVGGTGDGIASPIVEVEFTSVDPGLDDEDIDDPESPGEAAQPFDNMYPNLQLSYTPCPEGSARCWQDDRVVTVYMEALRTTFRDFDGDLITIIFDAVKSSLGQSFERTNLDIRRVNPAREAGEDETDIMYYCSSIQGAIGDSFCDDSSLPGLLCDQFHIRLDGAEMCFTNNDCRPSRFSTLRFIACHETGHTVGFVHPEEAYTPRISPYRPAHCTSGPPVNVDRSGLGPNQRQEVNQVYDPGPDRPGV